MKRAIVYTLLASAISGCATSPAGLEKPEYGISFTVDQGYQQTLKNILAADTECRPVQLIPIGQVINDVENYPDLREAKITQGASGIGRQIYAVISIKEADGKSVVTLYRKGPRKDAFVERLKRWASGSIDCKT